MLHVNFGFPKKFPPSKKILHETMIIYTIVYCIGYSTYQKEREDRTAECVQDAKSLYTQGDQVTRLRGKRVCVYSQVCLCQLFVCTAAGTDGERRGEGRGERRGERRGEGMHSR